VLGVDPARLLSDDSLPGACMEALEDNGVLVFRELFIDDETQAPSPSGWDDVGKAEPAAPPTIFNVTLDPTKSSTAAYLRGTVYWHIDGAQDDVPSKGDDAQRARDRPPPEARPSLPVHTRLRRPHRRREERY